MTRSHPDLPSAVLLGCAGNALSAARALHDRGVEVDVLGERRIASMVRGSRACRTYVEPSSSNDLQDEWLDWLLRRAPRGAVVIPCCDDGVEVVSRHRADLEGAGVRPVEASDDVHLAMLDKAATYELARLAGVSTPATMTLRSPADVQLAAATFEFPCAVKPLHSHLFARSFDVKAIRVASSVELVEVAEPIVAAGHPLLLTEVVCGPDDEYCSYYSFLDADGEPLLNFTKRKLRQYPTRFGSGTYHESRWDPEVAEAGLAFFRGVGLRGLGNVEFKRDGADGSLKLIECNPRLTAANELIRRSGLDLAGFLYARTAGLPLPSTARTRDGVHQWHAIDDLRGLRVYRREGQLTARAWAASLVRPQALPYFRWSDPAPAAINALRRSSSIARKLRTHATAWR